MTVSELRELLENMPDDAEVRLAFQPAWPLQFDIKSVVSYDPTAEYEVWDGPGEPQRGEGEQVVVYITQGDHPRNDRPYAPEGVWAL